MAAWIKIGTDWMKTRLDKLLVERGLAPTRERAQAMVVAGRVLVNEQKVDKPGTAIAEDAVFRLLGDDPRYVGRGGLKLEAALKHWQIDLDGKILRGCRRVDGRFYRLHAAARSGAGAGDRYRLWADCAESALGSSRVTLMERTNARLLKPGDLPEGISFLAMDVSFISATLVLPAVVAAIGGSLREAVILVKPQFDAGGNMSARAGLFAILQDIRWRLIA